MQKPPVHNKQKNSTMPFKFQCDTTIRFKPVVRMIVVAMLICGIIAVVPAQTLDKTVAVVRFHETVNINRSELISRVELLEEQVGRSLTTEQTEQILDAMINNELIRQAADRLSIRVNNSEIERAISQQVQLLSVQNQRQVSEAEFRDAIEEQTGISWADYRNQIKDRLVQEKYILRTKADLFQDLGDVSSRDVENYYRNNATSFTNPEIIHIQHLYVPTSNVSSDERSQRKERAEELLAEAGRSETRFQNLREQSLDDPSYSAGEELFLRENSPQQSQYGRLFIDAVFELDNDAIASSVIESSVGYHVIKVIDKRPAKVLQLDDPILPGQNITVRDRIRGLLVQEQQATVLRTAVLEAIEELKAEADIVLFLENI